MHLIILRSPAIINFKVACILAAERARRNVCAPMQRARRNKTKKCALRVCVCVCCVVCAAWCVSWWVCACTKYLRHTYLDQRKLSVIEGESKVRRLICDEEPKECEGNPYIHTYIMREGEGGREGGREKIERERERERERETTPTPSGLVSDQQTHAHTYALAHTH